MVIRQLHEAGYLSVTSARMTVICQLHEAEWRISFRYKRQDSGPCRQQPTYLMYLTENRYPASCN
jgi:hypothetical protein